MKREEFKMLEMGVNPSQMNDSDVRPTVSWHTEQYIDTQTGALAIDTR